MNDWCQRYLEWESLTVLSKLLDGPSLGLLANGNYF